MNIEFVYLIIQGINCFMNLAIDQSRASSAASFIVTKGPKKDAIITLKYLKMRNASKWDVNGSLGSINSPNSAMSNSNDENRLNFDLSRISGNSYHSSSANENNNYSSANMSRVSEGPDAFRHKAEVSGININAEI